ncbi:glutaredoxin family protein [Pseudalkalibacillus berkeleyi]|uniref:Glutaredoxin family protein n=1 Tax=Pseudalkalibacillus berkeleyi TaxID=1069813 RepID=A0ABS9H3L6_9BACL|nr:glutaredoxin family protein [Pseudalkalibacillus berkeleyi]MCF6138671.1 glutaredoxin family protein [Pseudalkalibacillus berkeleyi]
MLTVHFYTKKQCPLCDYALIILEDLQEELGFHIEERDIYEKDEWLEAYGLMIPVVQVEGKDIQYGKLDRISLRKRLLTFF